MELEKIINSLEEELGTGKSSFIVTSETGDDESLLLSTRAGAIELALVLLKQVHALDEKQVDSNWDDKIKKNMINLIHHPYIVGSYVFRNHADFIIQLKSFNEGNKDILDSIENDPEIYS